MAEREKFLLGELTKASEQLLCFRLDAKAKAERIRCRLNFLSGGATHEAHVFWSDRSMRSMLATLQDRIGQVDLFVESCRSALEAVHKTLFPLDDVPQGLVPLLKKFHLGEAIDEFVREQLIGGALVTLAFIRVHHPSIDLATIGKGLPPTADGGRVPMEAHYAAARGPTTSLYLPCRVRDQRRTSTTTAGSTSALVVGGTEFLKHVTVVKIVYDVNNCVM